MSVIVGAINDHAEYHSRKDCSVCGSKINSYPFLGWSGKPGIFICKKCFPAVKKGLIADLIHCEAVLEMQRAYPNHVLVREPIEQIEKRYKELETTVIRRIGLKE